MEKGPSDGQWIMQGPGIGLYGIGGVWETLVLTARLAMQGVAKQVRLLPDPLLNPTPPANCLPVCYRLLAGDSFWNSCNWPCNG